ncbi:MAG: hypothetical protein LBI15_06990 [Dysgonamonadaceae bacterium]|nr:hypothetical protein [Dysgonamonadaceae bacterium]
MATAVQNQILITVPPDDLEFFARLAKQFKWVTVPAQQMPAKQMSDKELCDLAEEIKSSMNPKAPKMSMTEIIQEVRDYRNGK